MTDAAACAGLTLLVAAILAAGRRPALQPLLRWLPLPLWCYALPLLAVSLGWLPRNPAAYRLLTGWLLPVALACLLIGADLPAVARSGRRALLAAAAGAASIVVGTALAVRIWHEALPAEAWKGAGALAGTWTGGTMNLLALRSVLETPEAVFAPLIIVDALGAYSWMALLVAASGAQERLNVWLRAAPPAPGVAGHTPAAPTSGRGSCWPRLGCGAGAVGLAIGARAWADRLPTSGLVSSAAGWTVLLITTAALLGSLWPVVRRLSVHATPLGQPALYLVLAATGAQADFTALWAAPAWLAVGGGVLVFHGAVLLAVGRWLRVPLGLLATASQANIGGVVSAPLVGAVYQQDLVPVGLLLAVAGNAVGTYLGVLAASLARALGALP